MIAPLNRWGLTKRPRITNGGVAERLIAPVFKTDGRATTRPAGSNPAPTSKNRMGQCRKW